MIRLSEAMNDFYTTFMYIFSQGRIRERSVALGLFYTAVASLTKHRAELGDSLKDECSESSHAPHSH